MAIETSRFPIDKTAASAALSFNANRQAADARRLATGELKAPETEQTPQEKPATSGSINAQGQTTGTLIDVIA